MQAEHDYTRGYRDGERGAGLRTEEWIALRNRLKAERDALEEKLEQAARSFDDYELRGSIVRAERDKLVEALRHMVDFCYGCYEWRNGPGCSDCAKARALLAQYPEVEDE